MKIISFVTPIRCGVYSFHLNLMRGLSARGCSTTWLCSGSSNAALIAGEGKIENGGENVASFTDDLSYRTNAIIEYVRRVSPDALLFHAVGDRVDFNAIRYLPDSVLKVLVVHGTTLAVYRAAQAVRGYVDAIVISSPRMMQDLISVYGFQKSKLHLIPNGIDLSYFSDGVSTDNVTGPLRILIHGRIDRYKGVLLLPSILNELAQHSNEWCCTISGDGPDLDELKTRLTRAKLLERVEFAGWTNSQDVPQLMKSHDVFLFPSNFEGSPLALIEAMASGCVPVASRLPGITDWIIEDGKSGFLFPVGNAMQAARQLSELVSGRSNIKPFRERAMAAVRNYGSECMAERYFQLLCTLRTSVRDVRPPEDLRGCAIANGLRPAWWYRIPAPVKDRLRLFRESIRAYIQVP